VVTRFFVVVFITPRRSIKPALLLRHEATGSHLNLYMSLNNEMLMELVRFLNREASQSDLEQLSLLIESLRVQSKELEVIE